MVVLMGVLVGCSGPLAPAPDQPDGAAVAIDDADGIVAARDVAAARAPGRWVWDDLPVSPFVVQVREVTNATAAPQPDGDATLPTVTLLESGPTGTPVITVDAGQWFRFRAEKPRQSHWPEAGLFGIRISAPGGAQAHAYFRWGGSEGSRELRWVACGFGIAQGGDGSSRSHAGLDIMREMGADSCIMQIPPESGLPPESGPAEYSFQPIYREWVEYPVDQDAADSITFEVTHDGNVLNDVNNCCSIPAKGFPSENLTGGPKPLKEVRVVARDAASDPSQVLSVRVYKTWKDNPDAPAVEHQVGTISFMQQHSASDLFPFLMSGRIWVWGCSRLQSSHKDPCIYLLPTAVPEYASGTASTGYEVEDLHHVRAYTGKVFTQIRFEWRYPATGFDDLVINIVDRD